MVYVIEQRDVQFENNWMRKILKTAKLDEAVGRVQVGSLRNCLNVKQGKYLTLHTASCVSLKIGENSSLIAVIIAAT